MMEVVICNHGDVFNTGNWYTFHCPECSTCALDDKGERKTECSCGCKLEWKDETP